MKSTSVLLFFLAVAGFMNARSAQAARFTSFPTQQVALTVFLVGRFDTNQINESSGVIPSRRLRGHYWTHNDGDNSLFGFTSGGRLTGKWRIDGPLLTDFEDMAWSPGRIYAADIGNNLLDRTNIFIYSVPEPGPTYSGRLPVKLRWRLSYPNNAPFDAEGFFIHRRYGYLVSKELVNSTVTLFRFPLRKSRSVLEPQCLLNVDSRVGGADLSRDGTRLALITDEGAYFFQLSGEIPVTGLLQPSLFVPFAYEGMEACAFTRDGLLVTSEFGEIFLFTNPEFRVPRI